MTVTWNRLAAWVMALAALFILPTSAILIYMNPAGQDSRAWEFLSGAVFGCGAPILGLVILRKQPHNRIGWLWLVIGWAIAYSSLVQGLKYQADTTPPGGYSSLVFGLLLFSETGYIVRFICLMLMMLWFPDGSPPSPRWRLLQSWSVISFILLTVPNFTQKVHWSSLKGSNFDAPLVDNPIGFLPISLIPVFEVAAAIGFFSIIGMSLLAVLAMIQRYRSSGQLVRVQIRWFVVGGIIYVAGLVASIILIDYSTLLPGILFNLAILPLYLAIGIAILRYRLFDIDILIRRTLQYSIVTGVLGMTYLGGVTVLQGVFTAVSGQQSPAAVVLSTLGIAALFNPLRKRTQDFIDRRFYRQKYDADKVLAEFAEAARSETDMHTLTTQLVTAVQSAIQPESTSVWMRPAAISPLNSRTMPTAQTNISLQERNP